MDMTRKPPSLDSSAPEPLMQAAQWQRLKTSILTAILDIVQALDDEIISTDEADHMLARMRELAVQAYGDMGDELVRSSILTACEIFEHGCCRLPEELN